MSAKRALVDLIPSLFSHSELQRLVALEFEELRHELPAEGNMADLAFAFVELLEQRGRIDERLWTLLLADRPGRSHDIERVWAQWDPEGPGAARTPAAPQPSAPAATSRRKYFDFELEVDAKAGDAYPVTVACQLAGAARGSLRLEIGEPDLTSLLGVVAEGPRPGRPRRHPVAVEVLPAEATDAETAARELGRRLFDALFSGDVGACYRASLRLARAERAGLRLRLRIEPAALAALPWELLFDAEARRHVCLSRQTPVVRYLDVPLDVEPLTLEPPLRVLGMIGAGQGLDVERERERMQLAIEHLAGRAMTLDWIEGRTWRDLQQAMRQGPWHIFHFIGHGGFDPASGEGQISLEGEHASVHRLGAGDLGELLADHRPLRLAILNSCEGARASGGDGFSSAGSVLAARGIPAVVSMQYEISDGAALELSRTFYDALAEGWPVDGALAEARKAIRMALGNTVEWATPVLHLRSPDGVLFDVDVARAIFEGAPATPSPAASSPAPDATSRQGFVAPALPSGSTSAPPPVDAAIRILSDRVRKFWIDGVLEESVHRAARLELDLELMEGAVDNPWAGVLAATAEGGRTLPAGGSPAEIFEELGGSLLILGEPGSGKTVKLLELARDLLDRAEADPSRSVPVVFNLSAWTDPDPTLFDWLVAELSLKYQIPKKVSRVWLERRRLLPLLDGLDEVAGERRSACVEAINAFTERSEAVGVVVCCRLEEYLALRPLRLRLNGAIRLRPIAREQVLAYTAAAGERLAALATLLRRDSGMLIEARSPLMLRLMVEAYQDLPLEALAGEGRDTVASRRKQLMDAYVARRFRRMHHG